MNGGLEGGVSDCKNVDEFADKGESPLRKRDGC